MGILWGSRLMTDLKRGSSKIRQGENYMSWVGTGSIKTYGSDRTCLFPLCGTILSKYNPDNLCWHHRNFKFPRKNHKVKERVNAS